ncbi:hypothetical protein D3C87_1849960 [compost metagenome]
MIWKKLARVSFIRAIDTLNWSTSSTGERRESGKLKSKLRIASASCTSARKGLTRTLEVSQPSGTHNSSVARVMSAPCQRIR